ncbi:hypothetical protein ACFELO_05475 [Oceanicaulis sp. LC35]|uniref:hypothetical protein n=1 Tax=Oceanicaulis sp. LC35 TaxID=3349635 RepID=UPI003F87E4FC
MPSRSDAILFLLGLVVYTAGQISINLMGAVTRAEAPVDISHWLMLLGVVLLLPFALRQPQRGLHLIATPVLVIGVVCVIGMCTLDLMFWSLPDNAYRNDLAMRLVDSPMLWGPFMQWGSNEVFTLGVALPALAYWRVSKPGVVLVVLGATAIAAGPHWFNVTGFILLTAGYGLALAGAWFHAAPDQPESA